jgi:hypothetical protein
MPVFSAKFKERAHRHNPHEHTHTHTMHVRYRDTMRVFSAKFKERADGRKQRERREASIRARAEKAEKKQREAQHAPPPTDLFSGPTLMQSMAAMQVISRFFTLRICNACVYKMKKVCTGSRFMQSMAAMQVVFGFFTFCIYNACMYEIKGYVQYWAHAHAIHDGYAGLLYCLSFVCVCMYEIERYDQKCV